jgi:hypothetical protein
VFFSKNFRDAKFDSYATIDIDPAVEGTGQWLDLEKMRTWYGAHRDLAPGGVFVGIELLSEKASEGASILYELPDGIQCGISLDPTIPDRVPEGSTLLGFDVATAGRFSGLADFDYTKEEVGELGPVWASRLNSFGLLNTLDDAIAFRRLSDRRVPEEAPFWVYALWRLPVG